MKIKETNAKVGWNLAYMVLHSTTSIISNIYIRTKLLVWLCTYQRNKPNLLVKCQIAEFSEWRQAEMVVWHPHSESILGLKPLAKNNSFRSVCWIPCLWRQSVINLQFESQYCDINFLNWCASCSKNPWKLWVFHAKKIN